MRSLKQYVSLFFAAILLIALIMLPVSAERTVVKHDGLEVVVETDQEQYAPGEPITATITVRNTSTNTITIANLEQLIPEGYRLTGSSKAGVQDIELRPEQTTTLKVTFVGEPEEQTAAAKGFFDKLLYGETWGIPNMLLAVLAAIAIVIFMLLT
ncbi:MAG: DUF11 domain-containing protein [Oscillospiraceae bacterium]|nr:DUF11 domain-containing protein [Oscillospiraceae bacterium]